MALGPGFTDCGFLVVASHVVPFDAISVEVVQDSEAGFRVWRILSCSPIVWLRQTSPSCVRPVFTLAEWDRSSPGIVPVDYLVGVVYFSPCPEVSLSILCDQSVEVILFLGTVQGHGFHSHGPTVLLSFMLLEGGATNFPSDHISSPNIVPRIGPEMIGRSCST